MKYLTRTSLSAFAALACSGALASGYNFGTQSVSAMSTADASAAEAADPGTIYYNPAGLTHLDSVQVSGNLILAKPSVKVKNAKAQYPNVGSLAGGPVSGTDNESIANDLTVVPHGYASWQVNPNITLGLGVYVPFGAKTEYSANSVLRYTVNKTELETIDINPTVAFKLNDQHSLAVGVIAQYAKAKLRKYANFAPVANKILTAGGRPPNVPNGAADGVANVEADDWGFGFNLGWMWDVNDSVRIGASYRSKITHNLKGTANWDLTGDAFDTPMGAVVAERIRNPGGYAVSESGQAKIVTPESVSLHGMWKATPQLDLFGNVTWTRHSRFKELDIKLGNTKQTLGGPSDTSRMYPKWRDTWRVSLGGAYQVSDPLQLRAGISYDQSPVKSPTHRLATLPDNDRIWFSVGAKYDFSKNSTLNVGYSYMYVKNGHAEFEPCPQHPYGCVDSGASGSADYRANAHFIGLQYTHRF